MSSWEYVDPVRNAFKIYSRERTPKQLAWGIALGMWVGILPKGNLLAILAGISLLAFRVNLGAGLTTAFIITACSPQLDQLTHGIGHRLLHHPTIHAWMSAAYQWPVVAWTSLNNTVVLGSFLLGLVLCYPTAYFSEWGFELLIPKVRELRQRLRRTKQAATPAAEPGA